MDKDVLKRLIIPAFFLLLFLVPALYLDTMIYQMGSELLRRTVWIGRYVIGTCMWLTLAWLLSRVIDDIVWPIVVERRLGYAVPRLLKDLVHSIIFVTAVGVIVSVVFEKSITGFLAASGVVGLVLGFALRSMIADFFSGIALNLERSFTIGDRIKLESGDGGFVMEVNWRTTVLRNFSANYLIIPNSKMAAAQIENFSKPQQFHWNWHFLTLEFDVPIERAERILEAAVRQGQAEFGVNTKVIARVREPNERGMEYVVVYRVPEYRLRGRMRAAIMRSIMHHFAVAGIRMVYPKYNIYTADMPLPQLEQQPNPHDLLQRVTLFTALDEAEMASLAARMTPHMFTAGEAVVEQGEIGTSMYSMYIVAEGLLYVYITQPESGDLIKVAELIPGQFFGEMSLLTGEPRSATVKAETDALVYEITKADMELLLDKRPEIAEHLAEIIAKRRLQNAEFMQNLPAEQQEVEVQNFAAQLLDKVRSFFGVFRGAAAKDQS